MKYKMKHDIAEEFLFFSYFGVSLADCKDKSGKDEVDCKEKLLNAAIDRAYVDAASHVLQLSISEDIKNKCKEDAKKVIYECINPLQNNEKLSASWHKELAKKLIDIYSEKEKNKFTFGMAQKWINMTIKYIYIMDSVIYNYLGKKNSCLIDVCERFREDQIDIPVDDYIIMAARDRDVLIPCKKNGEKEAKYEKMGKSYSNKLPWSRWSDGGEGECEYYNVFQSELKKKKKSGEHILEFENRIWIEEAKRRNNK